MKLPSWNKNTLLTANIVIVEVMTMMMVVVIVVMVVMIMMLEVNVMMVVHDLTHLLSSVRIHYLLTSTMT